MRLARTCIGRTVSCGKKNNIIPSLTRPESLCVRAKIKPTIWRGERESSWSRTFDFGNQDCKVIFRGLMQAFGTPFDVKTEQEWLNLFYMVISADGNEDRKICTLHSSSLLAFLFFGGISPKNTLNIGDSVYDDVFFEIKNKVFPDARATDKPSNVDIVLYSSTEKKLLYIESKFTEYLSHGKAFAAKKYREAFSKFLPYFKRKIDIISETRFISTRTNRSGKKQTIEGFNMKLPDRRTDEYMYGIKQALSHIIGIATGLPQDTPEGFMGCYNTAQKKSFLSVVFEIGKEFQKYKGFYSETIGQLSQECIEAILAQSGCDTKVENEGMVSYQGIIQDNPDYKLPKAFKGFYRLL